MNDFQNSIPSTACLVVKLLVSPHGICPGILFSMIMSFSSISTVSYIDELGHHDDNARLAPTMENTYQMGELAFLIAYKTGAEL